MKNIENISKWAKLHPKIQWLIEDTNHYLVSDLEKWETIKKIKEIFDKLLRFGRFWITKIETEKDFEEFMKSFEQIFKELEIDKLYNNTSRGNYEEFNNLDLFKQFFYITTPLLTNKNFTFIKWWVCYHWSIFFYNLFEHIDKNNKLDKKFIDFNPEFDHWVFQIWFKNKKYIIDPYSKGNGLLTEIKEWNSIYMWAILANLRFGKFTKNTDKVEILLWEKKIIPKTYKDKKEFINDLTPWDKLVNIKTYLNWKPIHINISIFDEDLLIEYKSEKLLQDKEFAIMDVVWLFMEKTKVSNLDILLALIGFKEGQLSKNIYTELKIIASKINKDFIFKKLWIEEDIKMFS